MRVFSISPGHVSESSSLPTRLPDSGYVWMAFARREFEVMQAQVQTALLTLCGGNLVDLHLSDLLNNQLPSHYDYTSLYDVLVFRRLAASQTDTDLAHPGEPLHEAQKDGVPKALKRINTSPVGFAVFDRVLLSVHPTECSVRDAYAERLLNASATEVRSSGARLPTDPADMMMRIVNHMVDGYLDLRRELTRDLDRWQVELLKEDGNFNGWASLLGMRLSLHQLDEICEDQRSAVQDWIEAVKTWSEPTSPEGRRERELLMVRSRDVLEHIERVIHHVDRLERSAETGVQMHFSVQGNRTNDTMKTLTILTAIFLPLNLITGYFGMNFEFIPLLKSDDGIWWATGAMMFLAASLSLVFWRNSLLSNASR
jgi:Mg2+ and Co2+ transporter CorA